MASEVEAPMATTDVHMHAIDQNDLINGDQEHATNTVTGPDASTNDNPSVDNSSPSAVETSINLKDSSVATDPNLTGPTPVEDVSSGIQPVADFLPKDVPLNSHPTPPPDQPLLTGEANVDTEMSNVDDTLPSQTASESILPATSPEASLVRPREDDDEDERVAKRSKVEDDLRPEPSISESAPALPTDSEEVKLEAQSSADIAIQPAATTLTENLIPPVAEVSHSSAIEQPVVTVVEDSIAVAPQSQPQSQPQPSDSLIQPLVHAEPLATGGEVSTTAQPENIDAKPSSTEATSTPQTSPLSMGTGYSTEPMTQAQKLYIVEKMKNLKKTKHSAWFLKPVDYVALNIPAYPQVITEPMDLGTMDLKLKADQYRSVQDFVTDFQLITSNTRKFNGDAHVVTQAGMSMEAYFKKMMENVPSASQPVLQKLPKKRSPSLGSKQSPAQPRESRAAAAAPAPQAGGETFALQADGMPQIRRDSSIKSRPARAIKPPQNRDLTYAKPKRKENMLELRFCEHVLKEIRSPRYASVNHVFQAPVDPVALNIPHYRQVVKQPMDLGTMAQKLNQGQYGKASEFKKDFDLIVANCLAFNPAGNAVRDMGIQLQRDFNTIWSQKDRWEKTNKPESQRATSASADEESEEEDDAPDEDKDAQIRALQKQLADFQKIVNTIADGGTKSAKPKKSSSKTKSSSKKYGSISSAPPKSKPAASKPKAKKPKQVTYEEKQEISEAVGRMNEAQVGRLTEIITQNCAKYRDMEEMELEIDDLPNDVQALLLKYVRDIFGGPKKAARAASPDDAAAVDDDDFEPERGPRGGGGGGKRKKHKPMGKREQGETIKTLQSKLAQFNGNGTSGSESPTTSGFQNNQPVDTSGDEESEESEEE